MGRITAYDQNGRMVADFDKSGYDLMWMRQGYEDEIESLTTENAKLRELVLWMYGRMDESCAAQYPYAPTPISYDRLMQAQARARELGIEVD